MIWFVRVRSDMERIAVRLPKFDCLIGKSIIASSVEHPNMRFAFCSAALLAGGLLLASITAASAESQGAEQKPPEQSEQKPPDQAQGEKKPEDQKSAEQQAEERIKQEIEQYREAAAKLSLSAGSAECVWTGRRITSLLWRDDVDTARRYHRPLRPLRLLGRASEADVSLRDSSGTDRSKSRGPACRPRA